MNGQIRPSRFHYRNHVVAALAMLVGVGLIGCAQGGSIRASSADGEPAELEPHSRPPVADMPIPAGFQLLEEQSHAFESPGVRFIDHTYRGVATKTQLERFYRKHLPARGWEFRNAQMNRGTHTLRFENGDEVLDVLITGEAGAFGTRHSRVSMTLQAVGTNADGPVF